MDNRKVTAISRQELYDRVWATPLTSLCRDFGVSNAELARACDEHDIPRPSSGYWAKKQHGKAAPPTPLPTCEDPELQTVEFRPQPTDQEEFDADVVALLSKARSLPVIGVPATLNDPHPMVRVVRDSLKGARPDTHNLVSTPWYRDLLLEVAVGQESVPRAMRFMNVLLKAIERIGGRVEVRPAGSLGRHQTFAIFCDEQVPFRLRERYTQEPKPPGKRDSPFSARCVYTLTGEFIVDRGRAGIDRAYAKDTADGRVEDRVNEIILALVTEAGNHRVARRQREVEQERREVEARLRREEAERERAGQERVEELLADAEAWRQGDALRGFIKAVEELALARKVNRGAKTELAAWLAWARRLAEELDPVATTLDRLTNKSAH